MSTTNKTMSKCETYNKYDNNMVAFKSYEGDLFIYIDQKYNLKCLKKN